MIGAARAAETGPGPLLAEIGGQLWRNLPGLLVANLVFLAWCAPYGLLALLGFPTVALMVAPLTVGPGLAGLLAYAARLARGETARAGRDSLRGAREGCVAGVTLAAVLTLAWQAHAVALGAALGPDAGWGVGAMWAGQVGVLALGALVGAHAFSLIALYRQGAVGAARNALVLALRRPSVAVALLALVAAAGGLGWMLAGGPLMILPAALAVCAVNTTRWLVEEVRG